MTTESIITKKEVDEVIEYFGEGKIPIMDMEENELQADFKPIRIGNVLEKIDKNVGGRNERIRGETYNEELIRLWQPANLSKSLQEILESSEWEEIRKNPFIEPIKVLKSPAKELFQFLHSLLNPKEI